MFLAATFLVALALTGLPMLPMLTLGAGCAVVGLTLRSGQKMESARKEQAAQKETAAAKPESKPEDQLLVDPLELELGVGLIRLADPAAGGDLLDRVTRVRHKVAQELGLILPKVRIRDNIRLDQREYRVKIRDVGVAKGEAYPEGRLAIDTGAVSGRIAGLSTTEPAFGRPAVWIDPAAAERAELLGYSVVEPSAVLITHLTEVVREHSAELLTRQQVHQLLEHLKQVSPKLVEELVPDVLKVAQIHQVLANLLRERVPIRDLEQILETLGDYADRVKDLGLLTEYVRHGLARTICRQHRDAENVLHVITIDPAVEDMITAGTDWSERGLSLKLAPQTSDAICRGIADTLKSLVSTGRPPVLLCGPQVRAAVRLITQASLPKLAVVSLNEVTRDTQVEVHGQVDANAVLKKDSGPRTHHSGARQEAVAAR
jgi:flagellar biosynthesis protein FlhA